MSYVSVCVCLQEGFKILKPPVAYQPIRTPTRKLTATPTPMGMSGFHFQMEDNKVTLYSIYLAYIQCYFY